MSFTIAVDAMGGDLGPKVTVPACLQALSYFPSLTIFLVGDHSLISEHLLLHPHTPSSRLILFHASALISDTVRPSKALRHSKGTSMHMALELVAQGKADACVSAGNTGALMALSRSLIKLIPGIERPALVSILPTWNAKKSWLLDLGANASVNAETLFQFALMGAVLAEEQLGYPPKVGLLNIGAEEIKGNELVKRCAEMLRECDLINYTGFIEGDQLFTGKVDVIVCDGFVGNVSLKTAEGVARLFIHTFYSHFSSNFFKKRLMKCFFGGLLKRLNHLKPDQYNGATLLGLRGIVIKSHGSADISAFQQAIREAVLEVERKIPNRIHERLDIVLLKRHC